jgi:hypothetical protein
VRCEYVVTSAGLAITPTSHELYRTDPDRSAYPQSVYTITLGWDAEDRPESLDRGADHIAKQAELPAAYFAMRGLLVRSCPPPAQPGLTGEADAAIMAEENEQQG